MSSTHIVTQSERHGVGRREMQVSVLILSLTWYMTSCTLYISTQEKSSNFPSVKYRYESESVSRSVVSDSLHPHRLEPTRLLCPWDSPGKNTGVGCHSLLQEIFPTEGSNLGLPHCKQILYHLSHQGSLQNIGRGLINFEDSSMNYHSVKYSVRLSEFVFI